MASVLPNDNICYNTHNVLGAKNLFSYHAIPTSSYASWSAGLSVVFNVPGNMYIVPSHCGLHATMEVATSGDGYRNVCNTDRDNVIASEIIMTQGNQIMNLQNKNNGYFWAARGLLDKEDALLGSQLGTNDYDLGCIPEYHGTNPMQGAFYVQSFADNASWVQPTFSTLMLEDHHLNNICVYSDGECDTLNSKNLPSDKYLGSNNDILRVHYVNDWSKDRGTLKAVRHALPTGLGWQYQCNFDSPAKTFQKITLALAGTYTANALVAMETYAATGAVTISSLFLRMSTVKDISDPALSQEKIINLPFVQSSITSSSNSTSVASNQVLPFNQMNKVRAIASVLVTNGTNANTQQNIRSSYTLGLLSYQGLLNGQPTSDVILYRSDKSLQEFVKAQLGTKSVYSDFMQMENLPVVYENFCGTDLVDVFNPLYTLNEYGLSTTGQSTYQATMTQSAQDRQLSMYIFGSIACVSSPTGIKILPASGVFTPSQLGSTQA